MTTNFRNWERQEEGYYLNRDSNYVVREVGREEREEWVILDDRGMMISCEWKNSKEICMSEADEIFETDKNS
jgi:hypothetical protein